MNAPPLRRLQLFLVHWPVHLVVHGRLRTSTQCVGVHGLPNGVPRLGRLGRPHPEPVTKNWNVFKTLENVYA